MIQYLTMGTLLGLSAGFAPGPLLALVISETLRHDVRSGIKVALAPIITDLPIILLSVLVLSKLSDFHLILGIISIVGGGLVFYLGVQSIRTRGIQLDLRDVAPKSLTKGILVNVLSPHPYLFWLTVGAPTMTRAMDQSAVASAAFMVGFYFFLVGSKMMLAVMVGKSKSFLSGKVYIYTMKSLGLALCVLALFLFKEGFDMVGIL